MTEPLMKTKSQNQHTGRLYTNTFESFGPTSCLSPTLSLSRLSLPLGEKYFCVSSIHLGLSSHCKLIRLLRTPLTAGASLSSPPPSANLTLIGLEQPSMRKDRCTASIASIALSLVANVIKAQPRLLPSDSRSTLQSSICPKRSKMCTRSSSMSE